MFKSSQPGENLMQWFHLNRGITQLSVKIRCTSSKCHRVKNEAVLWFHLTAVWESAGYCDVSSVLPDSSHLFSVFVRACWATNNSSLHHPAIVSLYLHMCASFPVTVSDCRCRVTLIPCGFHYFLFPSAEFVWIVLRYNSHHSYLNFSLCLSVSVTLSAGVSPHWACHDLLTSPALNQIPNNSVAANIL